MKTPGPSNVYICQTFRCRPPLLRRDAYEGRLGLLRRLVTGRGDRDSVVIEGYMNARK